MSMKATCPKNPNHQKFTTVAHVMEEWLVDNQGNWIETIDHLQTSFGPNPGNIWTCYECGTEAKVE